ncbi:MAG: peptide MFS transporter [Acidobacteriota bacterium]
MTTASDISQPKTEYSKVDTGGLGGHPRGLTTLFFTEMWERFSYYGMRALLTLYMYEAIVTGGLGFEKTKATSIYGLYTASVYLAALPGGWIADNILGARLAVLLGGIIIALGHYSMAFASLDTFYAGMVLIVIGTGLLKPNISTMVGSLYSPEDTRRDGGFSIFYMGINLGAFLSPLVCGYLAQSAGFKAFLAARGFDPNHSWHWGFAAAGVGMTLGLVQYLVGRERLAQVGNRLGEINPEKLKKLGLGLGGFAVLFGILYLASTFGEKVKWGTIVFMFLAGFIFLLSRLPNQEEKRRVAVVGILFIFSTMFWAAFEQAGSSMNLFADILTRNSIFGWEFPSSWFQSVNSLFIIALAPVFSWLWLKLGNRQPSSPAKFSLGLLFAGLGFVVLAFASTLTGGGVKVSPAWLVIVYFLHTIGELCLSPVGLSTTTKLAPSRLVGMMMGIWYLSLALGSYIGGQVAGFFDEKAEGALVKLFGAVALSTILGAGILVVLTPYVRKLMGKIR